MPGENGVRIIVMRVEESLPMFLPPDLLHDSVLVAR